MATMFDLRHLLALFSCLAAIAGAAPAIAATPVEPAPENSVRVAIASGLVDSGLVKWIVDDFRAARPDIGVEVESAGLGEAYEMGRTGQVDLVISHHRPSEELFVGDGFGGTRTVLMYAELAFFGPPEDKLRLSGQDDLRALLQKLAKAQAPFYAPAPSSGAGLRLAELWTLVGIAPGWSDYEVLADVAPNTLAPAAKADGYAFGELAAFRALPATLRDRLQVLTRPLAALRDYYAVVTLSGERVPGVRQEPARAFRDYLLSERGQDRIGSFRPKGSDAAPFRPAAFLDDGLHAQRLDHELRSTSLMLYLAIACAVGAAALATTMVVLWRRASRRERRHRGIERRFALAVEASRDGIWDWDLNQDQVYLSHRFREIARLQLNGHWFPAPRELWTRIIDPTDRECVTQAIDHALAKGASGAISLKARLADSTRGTAWVLIRGKVHRRHREPGLRIVGTISEIDASQDQDSGTGTTPENGTD